MKGMHRLGRGLLAGMPLLCLCGSAAVIVDTSPGTGAPPGTLGGYAMCAFPGDLTPEGTLITELTPPLAAPVTGKLTFATEVEHFVVGSLWNTWSHGYKGDVYYTGDHDLMMTLPAGTLAFSLYVEPNLKAVFEFEVDSGAQVATLNIDGNGGARYIGFYTDDDADPLQFVYVHQTTMDSDGFAVGEFQINCIPEPGAWAGLTALGLCAWIVARRFRS